MKNKDFAVFILTHGRPNKVYTYDCLRSHGYTGKIYIIIDNEDDSASQYRAKYGEQVIVFDKKEIAKTFDSGDNFDDRRAIIYARNASFEIAKSLGLKYFIELDDDYTVFAYKFDEKFRYHQTHIKNLDRVFDILLEFYKVIPAKSIAFAQNGDFIGGATGSFSKHIKLRRKCMNTFICSVDRPFKFMGRINEDVNTYTRLGSVGQLFFTVPNVNINQIQTQSNSGGMTELYLDSGTYLKSFYSIMYQPSSVKISLMGSVHKRLHHLVHWKNTTPFILSETHKKQ